MDIWVPFQEVRAHWLILFGLLLQFVQLLVELGKAWFCPKKPRVLPHVRTTDIACLCCGVLLGDQFDLPGAEDRVAHVFPAAVLEHIERRATLLQPIDLFVLGQEWPGAAAVAIPYT